MRISPTKLLRKAKLKAFLVTSPVNIRYLTGGEFSEGRLLILPKKSLLFLDGRYTEAAQALATKDLQILPLSKFAEILSKSRKVGIESERITVAQEDSMKKKYKNTKFVHLHHIIEEFRRAKMPDELKKFQRSQQITKTIIKMIPKWLDVGVREIDIAWKIREAAHKLGAEDLSFDPIVAFGENTSRPHHHAGTRKLRKDDIIQIDCGVKYEGYCSDQSEVLFFGKALPKQKKTLAILRQVHRLSVKRTRQGVLPATIDREARTLLKKHALDECFTHSLGHGVGLEIHESPSLSRFSKDTALQKNEIVTIEPGVYFPGEWGMRVETEVIVKR